MKVQLCECTCAGCKNQIFHSDLSERSLLDGLRRQDDPFHWESCVQFLLWEGTYLILFKLAGLISNYSFSPQMFGVSQPSYIDENLTDLPELENEDSERLRSFVVSFKIFNKKTNVLTLFSVLRRAWICGRVTLCLWGLSGTTPRLEHCLQGTFQWNTSFILNMIANIASHLTCNTFSLLADDRSENTFSYYEFLQHLKTQVKWSECEKKPDKECAYW